MDLTRFRPASNTAVAIASALTAAQASVAVVDAHIAEAKQTRDAALLDAGAKELRGAEDALTLARGDGERLTAIIAQLSDRLGAAREHEAMAKVRAAEQAVSAANANMNAFEAQHGDTLLDLHDQGFELHRARLDAGWALRRAQGDVMAHFPAAADQAAIPLDMAPLTPAAEKIAEMYAAIDVASGGTVLDPAMAELNA